jgi:hypothetical protein
MQASAAHLMQSMTNCTFPRFTRSYFLVSSPGSEAFDEREICLSAFLLLSHDSHEGRALSCLLNNFCRDGKSVRPCPCRGLLTVGFTKNVSKVLHVIGYCCIISKYSTSSFYQNIVRVSHLAFPASTSLLLSPRQRRQSGSKIEFQSFS